MRIRDWSSDVCSSDLIGPIVERHVLQPFARERLAQLLLIGEVVASIMQSRPVAVATECDIGGMVVESGRRQHMGVCDRHPLSLVDSGGIAVIDKIGRASCRERGCQYV